MYNFRTKRGKGYYLVDRYKGWIYAIPICLLGFLFLLSALTIYQGYAYYEADQRSKKVEKELRDKETFIHSYEEKIKELPIVSKDRPLPSRLLLRLIDRVPKGIEFTSFAFDKKGFHLEGKGRDERVVQDYLESIKTIKKGVKVYGKAEHSKEGAGKSSFLHFTVDGSYGSNGSSKKENGSTSSQPTHY